MQVLEGNRNKSFQVIDNVGGRLLLRYDTPDSCAPEFWLYFTSPRIFPMGWCAGKGVFIYVEL